MRTINEFSLLYYSDVVKKVRVHYFQVDRYKSVVFKNSESPLFSRRSV